MSPSEIGSSWSDEQLILCLESIQTGSPEASLPNNVVSDVNPYLHDPSELPEGIWYVVYSKDPKQALVGFWKVKGDPCQVYSSTSFTGWRTNLEFYEGESPNGHRTDWVMQDYSITDNIPSNGKERSSLCRVFLSDEQGKTKATDDAQDQINILHVEDNKPLKRKLDEEMKRYQFMDPANQEDRSVYSDCFEEGDFLEIQDLLDDNSSSCSSGISFCDSPSSDQCFDSVALLNELEDDVSNTKDSPIRSEIKTTETVKAEGSNDEGASSSRRAPGGDKGKKVQPGKMMKKFFCFVAF